MYCYVLVFLLGGIVHYINTYQYDSQGLESAKREAKRFAINELNPDNLLCLYDCQGNHVSSDILDMTEIMQWRKDAGLNTWI